MSMSSLAPLVSLIMISVIALQNSSGGFGEQSSRNLQFTLRPNADSMSSRAFLCDLDCMSKNEGAMRFTYPSSLGTDGSMRSEMSSAAIMNPSV